MVKKFHQDSTLSQTCLYIGIPQDASWNANVWASLPEGDLIIQALGIFKGIPSEFYCADSFGDHCITVI